MRCLVLLIGVMALSSCNTTIGLYRDAKHAFQWSKAKVQGTDAGSQESYAPPGGAYDIPPETYNAPVY